MLINNSSGQKIRGLENKQTNNIKTTSDEKKDRVEVNSEKTGIGQSVAQFLKEKEFIQKLDNPDVIRKGNKEDNFDHFEGLNLGFMKIGKFTEAPHKHKETETVKVSDTMAEDKAMKYGMDSLKAMGSTDMYKIDFSTVQMEKEATVTHNITEKESFKGITIGKKLKIGSTRIEQEDSPSTSIKFHYDVTPFGKQKRNATLNFTMGNVEDSGILNNMKNLFQ